MQQPAARRGLLPAVFLAVGCTTIAGINEDYSQVVGAGGAGTSGRSGSGSGGELVGGSNAGGASSGGASSGGAQGGSGAEDGALDAGGAAGDVGAAGAPGSGGGSAGGGGTGGSDGGAGAAGQGGAIDCPTDLRGPELVRVPSPDGIDYCIDATEVTNKQYAAFVGVLPGQFQLEQPPECYPNAFIPNISWPPPSNRDDDPVAGIDWCDANAFCQWAGKRLCGKIGGGANPADKSDSAQSSQWFNACSKGGTLKYPYGPAFAPTKCNDSLGLVDVVAAVKTTAECVGGYPGLYDMSGNVAEWEDSCDGSAQASCHVRGGSFQGVEANLDCARALPRLRTSNSLEIGFRCCRDLK